MKQISESESDIDDWMNLLQWKEFFVLYYCTNYDNLRELIFHEVTQQKPEIICCTGEQTLSGCLVWFQFIHFVSKAKRLDESFSQYLLYTIIFLSSTVNVYVRDLLILLKIEGLKMCL